MLGNRFIRSTRHQFAHDLFFAECQTQIRIRFFRGMAHFPHHAGRQFIRDKFFTAHDNIKGLKDFIAAAAFDDIAFCAMRHRRIAIGDLITGGKYDNSGRVVLGRDIVDGGNHIARHVQIHDHKIG